MDRTSGRAAIAAAFTVATAISLVASVGKATPGWAASAEISPAPEPAQVPDGLAVLSSEELSSVFAAVAMSSGRATVVAETTIRRDVPRHQLRCVFPGQKPPPRTCPLGVVEPGEAGRGFMPVVARKAATTTFPDDRSPIEGTLAYRIDADQLELLGPLATPTGSPLVAVDPRDMAVADALPVGSLIAVDGWLGVLGIGARCPPGLYGWKESSPFAICPTGWITASGDQPAEDPDRIPLVPDGYGIKVQSNAYEAFARDPRPAGPHATLPRRATHLLRHVEAGPPHDRVLGWKGVGRLDSVEGAGPRTTMAASRGLLLELWLDQATVPVGERLMGLVRVSNVGTGQPRWESNICGTGPAPTVVVLSRPKDLGIAWTGKAAIFKRKLLAEELRPELLVDVGMIDIEEAGCTANSAIETFGPGSVSQMVVAWDAVDRPGRPILPGPVIVTSTFKTWKPRGKIDLRQADAELVATTTVEITGEPGRAVPLFQYIDAALSDDTFRAWVQQQRRPRSWEPKAIWWPTSDGEYPRGRRYERATEGAVDIGMFGPGPVGEVTIDTATFEVLGGSLPR